MRRKSKEQLSIACDVCGKGEARVIHVTRSYGRGDDLLVIENVPVISCPRCGASYLTSKTLHELERIKAHRRSATKRPIPVAEYA